MFTNPFRRGRGVDRWPKLARVIDKGGGQDGAHALGVGAQGQGDAKGDDNGVLAFGCRGHSSSMSPGPVLVEARDLAGIVGRRLVVGHGRRAGVRRPDVVAAWSRRPGGFREIYGSQFNGNAGSQLSNAGRFFASSESLGWHISCGAQVDVALQ